MAGAVLLRSGYALTTTDQFPSTLPILALLFSIFSVIALVRSSRTRSSSISISLFLCIILATLPLLSGLVSGGATIIGTLAVVVTIVCAFAITSVIPFQTFVNWWVGVTRVVTVVAFLAHLTFVWLGLPFVGGTVTNVNGARYMNGWIVFLLELWDGSPSSRAMGPFWEPGLFASVLIIGLLLEICFREGGPRKQVIATLVVGLIISESTAGYLLLIPVMLALLARRFPRVGSYLTYFTVAALVVVWLKPGPFVSWLVGLNPSLFGKLDIDTFLSSTRSQSNWVNLAIFEQRPLFGWGPAGADAEFARRMDEWGVGAQTATSTYFLAAFGVAGIIYTVAWVASIWANMELPLFARVTVTICMLIILNKEPHFAILSTWILLFYFCREAERSRGQRARVV